MPSLMDDDDVSVMLTISTLWFPGLRGCRVAGLKEGRMLLRRSLIRAQSTYRAYNLAKGESHTSIGLTADPFKALIVPRPIGWITTCGETGVNTAPYSFFAAVSTTPYMVMFTANGSHAEDGGAKDSVANAVESGEFVVNIASESNLEAVAGTGAHVSRSVDEGSHPALGNSGYLDSLVVAPPRLAVSPAHLECSIVQTLDLPSDSPRVHNTMVIGRVEAVHISHNILDDKEEAIDVVKLAPLARMGGFEYATINSRDQIRVPPRSASERNLRQSHPDLFPPRTTL